MFPKPNIILEILNRDEFKFDESKVWPNFKQGKRVSVTLTGVVLIPGKILIAVGKPIAGLAEVPCVALAKNSWEYGARDSIELCQAAVQRRGSTFRDMIGSVKCKQGSVKCRFADSPFNVYYAGLA